MKMALSSTQAATVSPVFRPPSLRIDKKPTTGYCEGHIVVDTGTDLRQLVVNKGDFHITHIDGPWKHNKILGVPHHYIQQHIQSLVITLIQGPSSEQNSVFLTIPVGRKLFKQALRNIGLTACRKRGLLSDATAFSNSARHAVICYSTVLTCDGHPCVRRKRCKQRMRLLEACLLETKVTVAFRLQNSLLPPPGSPCYELTCLLKIENNLAFRLQHSAQHNVLLTSGSTMLFLYSN